jgi:hypothetical protein
MGNAVFHKPDVNIVYVDEESVLDPLVQGVARGIFKKFEWETLKLFSQKYRIVQSDINVVFRRFLMYQEVHLLKFHVRTNDVKGKFLLGTKLIVVSHLTVLCAVCCVLCAVCYVLYALGTVL